jgi:hypothetical protein
VTTLLDVLGRRAALFSSPFSILKSITRNYYHNEMAVYTGFSFAEIKVECRRYGISTYGKKSELVQKLLESLVKRMKETLYKTANATNKTFYPSMTLPEIKTELKARKLPVSGTKDALVQRLRDADWKEWDSRLQTFPQFAQLPVEIQEYIWQYSLPGPRVLATAHTRSGGPNGLYFPKVDHTPNPAALSTCRLSRKIALKRYRLVFGTNNIYANLEGGDIFYIAPFSRSFLFGRRDLWECENGKKDPAATVIADLEKVTHLLLGYSFAFYRNQIRLPQALEDRENSRLRTDLTTFKSLKTLSLSCGGSDDGGTHRSPGQTYVEYDIMKFKPMDAGDYWSYHPKETALAIKSCLCENPSDEDIARGIPEVQLVEVHRLPDTPCRELQDANGQEHAELYVRLLPRRVLTLLILHAV